MVLAARAIPVSDAVREKILGCTDVAVLDVWLKRAAVSSTAAAVVRATSRPRPPLRKPPRALKPLRPGGLRNDLLAAVPANSSHGRNRAAVKGGSRSTFGFLGAQITSPALALGDLFDVIQACAHQVAHAVVQEMAICEAPQDTKPGLDG